MTEQEKREKVIKGLECCNDRFCFDCQYNDGKGLDSDFACRDSLFADAIALLKAQEPRTLSLHEIHFLQRNDVVWLEDKVKPETIPAITRHRFVWPHSTEWVTDFILVDNFTLTAGDNDYNQRWRCWTSRPTDAQREAIPWQ